MKPLIAIIGLFKRFLLLSFPQSIQIQAIIYDTPPTMMPHMHSMAEMTMAYVELPESEANVKVLDVTLPDGTHQFIEVDSRRRGIWKKLEKGTKVLLKQINKGFRVEYQFHGIVSA